MVVLGPSSIVRVYGPSGFVLFRKGSVRDSNMVFSDSARKSDDFFVLKVPHGILIELWVLEGVLDEIYNSRMKVGIRVLEGFCDGRSAGFLQRLKFAGLAPYGIHETTRFGLRVSCDMSHAVL